MSDFGDDDIFAEFAPFGPDVLDFLDDPDLVRLRVQQLPYILRPLFDRLATLGRDERFYGEYTGWHVVSSLGRFSQLVRFPGGLSESYQYQLAVGRDLDDRHRSVYANWMDCNGGHFLAFADPVFAFITLEGEMGLVNSDERVLGDMPDELPVGTARAVLDVRGADPQYFPTLVIKF
jgi:hypothetical protein